MIDPATNTVVGSPIPVGTGPTGISVDPNGARVYVVNTNSNNVSVIDTATNAVIGTPIAVGRAPRSLGKFISAGPRVTTESAPIPSLSWWALLMLVWMLGGVGATALTNRKHS